MTFVALIVKKPHQAFPFDSDANTVINKSGYTSFWDCESGIALSHIGKKSSHPALVIHRAFIQ